MQFRMTILLGENNNCGNIRTFEKVYEIDFSAVIFDLVVAAAGPGRFDKR